VNPRRLVLAAVITFLVLAAGFGLALAALWNNWLAP
jgi:hypothetical protein